MNLSEYQAKAARTLNSSLSHKTQTQEYLLGVLGETGEIIDVIKKHLFHKHDLAKLPEELGDLCWYCAALCTTWEIPMSDFRMQATKHGDLFDCATALWRKADRVSEAYFTIGTGLAFMYGVEGVLEEVLGLCEFVNISLSSVLEANIFKLEKRYPEKFSIEASLKRSI